MSHSQPRTAYRHIRAGFLISDGHRSFAPGEEWIVTDDNVSAKLERHLLLCSLSTEEHVALGAFPMFNHEFVGGDLRRDRRPRWSDYGTSVCFDAMEPRNGICQSHVAALASSQC